MGVEPHRIVAWTKAGRLHRVHNGVYAVGQPALSSEAHLLAAVLSVGPDAVMSHQSAALTWGFIRSAGDPRREAVDVSAPRRLNRRARIRTHFAPTLERQDRMFWDRIPITTPARTLRDLASVLSEDALRQAIRRAQVDKRTILRDLDEHLVRMRPCAPGARRLAAVLAEGPTPTRSELEDGMLALLARHGFPRPQVNVPLQLPGRQVEVDFLYPDRRLVLETDGDRFHGTRLAREADAARQADLETAGYRVVRLSYQQVIHDEQRTVARLRRIFERQAA